MIMNFYHLQINVYKNEQYYVNHIFLNDFFNVFTVIVISTILMIV